MHYSGAKISQQRLNARPTEQKMVKVPKQQLLTDDVGVKFFDCKSFYLTVHYPHTNLKGNLLQLQ